MLFSPSMIHSWHIIRCKKSGTNFPTVWKDFNAMSNPKEPKWACEYCTYENYPSSLKCTMCRGPKPFVSEDIYRLCEDNTVNIDDSIETATGPIENRSKGNMRKYFFALLTYLWKKCNKTIWQWFTYICT